MKRDKNTEKPAVPGVPLAVPRAKVAPVLARGTWPRMVPVSGHPSLLLGRKAVQELGETQAERPGDCRETLQARVAAGPLPLVDTPPGDPSPLGELGNGHPLVASPGAYALSKVLGTIPHSDYVPPLHFPGQEKCNPDTQGKLYTVAGVGDPDDDMAKKKDWPWPSLQIEDWWRDLVAERMETLPPPGGEREWNAYSLAEAAGLGRDNHKQVELTIERNPRKKRSRYSQFVIPISKALGIDYRMPPSFHEVLRTLEDELADKAAPDTIREARRRMYARMLKALEQRTPRGMQPH